jgi:hypothetical protein
MTRTPQRARGIRATTKGATGPNPRVSAVIFEIIPGKERQHMCTGPIVAAKKPLHLFFKTHLELLFPGQYGTVYLLLEQLKQIVNPVMPGHICKGCEERS